MNHDQWVVFLLILKMCHGLDRPDGGALVQRFRFSHATKYFPESLASIKEQSLKDYLAPLTSTLS